MQYLYCTSVHYNNTQYCTYRSKWHSAARLPTKSFPFTALYKVQFRYLYSTTVHTITHYDTPAAKGPLYSVLQGTNLILSLSLLKGSNAFVYVEYTGTDAHGMHVAGFLWYVYQIHATAVRL